LIFVASGQPKLRLTPPPPSSAILPPRALTIKKSPKEIYILGGNRQNNPLRI
jgi:hypothetical protein